MFKNSVQLIVYDFDGVMTDNKVYVDQNGREMVQVNRGDGLGVSEITKLGIEQIIISTESNPVVSVRAEKLGILCLQAIENKKMTLIEYCKSNKISLENTAFVGNDSNDKEVMETVGTTFCPSDAHGSIKDISDYVLKTKGGNGVIRELFDLITIKERE
ncbi:HAD hydrolase family protein [candidate division KSB1 bacterium]|nr:HAD hydrolase family protein [candidate division KSB1 bacterium]